MIALGGSVPKTSFSVERNAAASGRGIDDESDSDDNPVNVPSTSDIAVKEGNDLSDSDKYSKTRSGKTVITNFTDRWEDMFNRLVEFRKSHGHCQVPSRYEDDPQLGVWVATQRRQHKLVSSGRTDAKTMTPDRAARLEEIGFAWSAKDPRCETWDFRFKQLLEFVLENGHAHVPIRWEENYQLANWVFSQRQEHKNLQKGRNSRLTKERMRLLNSVGFVWEAQRGGSKRVTKGKNVPVPKTSVLAKPSLLRDNAKCLLDCFSAGRFKLSTSASKLIGDDCDIDKDFGKKKSLEVCFRKEPDNEISSSAPTEAVDSASLSSVPILRENDDDDVGGLERLARAAELQAPATIPNPALPVLSLYESVPLPLVPPRVSHRVPLQLGQMVPSGSAAAFAAYQLSRGMGYNLHPSCNQYPVSSNSAPISTLLSDITLARSLQMARISELRQVVGSHSVGGGTYDRKRSAVEVDEKTGKRKKGSVAANAADQ